LEDWEKSTASSFYISLVFILYKLRSKTSFKKENINGNFFVKGTKLQLITTKFTG